MPESRTVASIFETLVTTEGDGLPVRRGFPTQSLDGVDPFLLLDHFGPVEFSLGSGGGVPDHPHRGFETVTYMFEGRFEHRDSAGHAGVIGPGDVQWMTAGSGIIHSEMPEESFRRQGGRLEGLQLWVNLPKADKMMDPRYQQIEAAEMPSAQSGDEEPLSCLLLSAAPLGEPVARYGPFVMNTKEEIIEAIDDYNNGRLIRGQAA